MSKAHGDAPPHRHAIRRETNLEEVQMTPFVHRYLLQKPRGHQQHEAEHPIDRDQPANTGLRIDNPKIEKRRFELFIDLIWVGIIGNLAESFSENAFNVEEELAVGLAIWHFIILFLMAWRFWLYLQKFMSKYHTSDLIQRWTVMWGVILAMMFGNNAPYLFDSRQQTNLAIILYTIWRASLLLVEAYYSIFLPHIRKRIAIQFLVFLPAVAIWIVATFVDIDTKAGLAFAATGVEYFTLSLSEWPIVERLLHKDDRGETYDMDHWVDRLQDFYIIVLGEGVLSLIRGSPLGRGISDSSSAGLCVLLIIYVLSGFYFNGDSSRSYVHATKRQWWRKMLWQFLHNSLYGSTLILGVTAVFLLQHPLANGILPEHNTSETPSSSSSPKRHLLFPRAEISSLNSTTTATSIEPSPSSSSTEPSLSPFILSARWTFAGALALALLILTLVALSSRSLDKPHTLKINNRYVRLAPRVGVIVVVCCLPIADGMNNLTYLAVVASAMMATLLWEWGASLDRGGGIVEK